MTLPSSGAISLSQVQGEFGGSNPISLSEYYRGGSYTTSNNTGVPTSGTISLSNFYGAVRQFSFTISSSVKEANLRTLALNAGWDGSSPVIATVASNVYLWSDNTSVGGLTIPSNMNVATTLINYGKIIGRGGDAYSYIGTGPFAGGPALVNQETGVTVINASGAYIAGGGGGGGGTGGGGGAGGGKGGDFPFSGYVAFGGAGGSIGNAGADGQAIYLGGLASQGGDGGGSGGGGGNYEDSGSGFQSIAGGGGGGRILPGVGGVAQCGPGAFGYGGGAGGSGGNAGGPGCNGGFGGGGGWGAAGSGGGAGGAAISGTAVSLTNNGTIYGAVA